MIFGLFKKAPKQALTRAQCLQATPRISGGVHLERTPAGEPVLLVERQVSEDSSRFGRKMFGKMGPRQLILDDLGTYVFGLIDGERTVREISSRFAEEHSLHPREAETSVTAFLNLLVQRNAITVVIPETETV